MSTQIVRSPRHQLLLVSAALLFQVGGAEAADLAIDAQQQMRQVLAGQIGTQSPSEYARREVGPAGPATEAREYAAQLLRGSASRGQAAPARSQLKSVVAPAPLTVRERSGARDDAQALARQVVLGRQNAVASDSGQSSVGNRLRVTERIR